VSTREKNPIPTRRRAAAQKANDEPRATTPEQASGSLRVALWLFSLSALVGCSASGFSNRRDDNPKVRALQAASVSRYGDRPIAGESIDGFFRNKVGLMTVKGGMLPVGRAAPISADGYYLTAWHVVEKGDFRLSNSVSSANPLRVVEYPGRVVWHDSSADLAIVKFGYRPSARFSAQQPPLAEGEAVFSGASGLNSGTRLTRLNASGRYDLNDLIRTSFGNGDFRTAGKITNVRVLDKGSLRWIYESTLVGRGGMSGAPVVNSKGHLVGIVTGGQAKPLSGLRTTFSMLDPTAMEEILHADRSRP
jgi:S1-C subfamily serine protease